VMCHYPMLIWDKHQHGAWHLFGHCHYGLWKFMLSAPEFEPLRRRKMLDVGVDNPLCNYSPFSFAEIKSFMDKQEVIPLDHHQ
jgi:hypothetical protein